MSRAEGNKQLPTAPEISTVCDVIRKALYRTAAAASNTTCHEASTADLASGQVLQVTAALEHFSVGTQQGELDAVLSVIAPAVLEDGHAPLRLVAVLDKSRSMKGEKIRLVQKTMLFILEHLSENDALGLVGYDQTASVLAPLTFCDEAGRSRLEAAVLRLRHGKGTNISDGLMLGLGLHAEAARRIEAGPPPSEVRFGNKYRRLCRDAQTTTQQDGKNRVHEWTMELHVENEMDAALITKVVYKLHDSFRESEVEVLNSPFRLCRVGWGTFCVRATLHLQDGRLLKLDHDLCFDGPESFKTQYIQLRQATVKVRVSAALTGNEWGVIDACGKPFVHDLHPDISKLVGTDITDILLINRNGAILNDHNQVSAMNDAVVIETSAPDRHKTILKLEYQDAQSSHPTAIAEDSVVRSTFMFTDGLATAGVMKAEEICAKTEEKLRHLGSRRCTLTTFGFGVDHNEELLQNLADKGRGSYSFIEGDGNIGEAFGEAVGGLLTTSHQDVRLCLDLAPGVRLGRAHTTFPVERCDTGVEFAIGNLFADEQRNILVTFHLPAVIEETSGKDEAVCLGQLGARGMRTFNPVGSEEAEYVKLHTFRRQDDHEVLAVRSGSTQVARHRNRLMATDAFAEARAACAQKRLEKARHILQEAINKLCNSPLTQQGDALSVGLLTDLMVCLEDLMDDCNKACKSKDRKLDRVGVKASKTMASCYGSYTMERSIGGSANSSMMYENLTQKTMRDKFKKSAV